MTQVDIARDQISTARRYTQGLLEQLDPADWFRTPQEAVTHIAWQIGHLAMAEYRLALERLRGSRAEDERLISSELLTLFGKGSTPAAIPAQYPPPAEILAVFDCVHQQTLAELSAYTDANLQSPPVKPHKLFDRKIDALFWCARHEMLHAGQIGLLRRLLGYSPQW